jgi:hypothetical protein
MNADRICGFDYSGVKELRESFNALRVIRRMAWIEAAELEDLIDENNQLISIFVKSIETARKNNKK